MKKVLEITSKLALIEASTLSKTCYCWLYREEMSESTKEKIKEMCKHDK